MSQAICGTGKEKTGARRDIRSFDRRKPACKSLSRREQSERATYQAGCRFPFFWISSDASSGALFRNHVTTTQIAAATMPATNNQL